MQRAYSQDLRWRAIWLTEILGFEIDKVSLLLQISTKTISRYVRKFRMLGHVDTAVIGPYLFGLKCCIYDYFAGNKAQPISGEHAH